MVTSVWQTLQIPTLTKNLACGLGTAWVGLKLWRLSSLASNCRRDTLAHGSAHRRRSVMIHDEPGASLAGKVGPTPLQENTQPEAGCGQKLEVNERPNQPRPQPARLDFAALQHRKTLAHHRHAPLVEVAKWSRRLAAGCAAVNEFSCITSLLHGHLRHAGKGL